MKEWECYYDFSFTNLRILFVSLMAFMVASLTFELVLGT